MQDYIYVRLFMQEIWINTVWILSVGVLVGLGYHFKSKKLELENQNKKFMSIMSTKFLRQSINSIFGRFSNLWKNVPNAAYCKSSSFFLKNLSKIFRFFLLPEFFWQTGLNYWIEWNHTALINKLNWCERKMSMQK